MDSNVFKQKLVTETDLFKLTADTQRVVQQVQTDAHALVKEHFQSPRHLTLRIEAMGTPVFYGLHGGLIHLVLFFLGFEPGYIPPVDTWRFRMLLSFLSARGQVSGENGYQYGLFFFTHQTLTISFIAHQLHHWLAYKAGLPGYHPRDKVLYRQFWQRRGILGQEIHTLSSESLWGLKHAINRDLEATRFLKRILEELVEPFEQGNRFQQGQAQA